MNDEKPKAKNAIWNILTPVLVIAVIGLSFLVGTLWQRVVLLEGGNVNLFGTNNDTNNNGQVAGQGPTNGKLSDAQAAKVPEVTDKDHVRGDLATAEIYLVEYSDYECPFCKQFHPTATQIVDDYAGKVAWVYRHFPLDSLHPKARPAAEAAECVASLGGNDAFWVFSDAAFEVSPTGLSDLETLATQAGVDAASYKTCIEGDEAAAAVQSQYDGGSTAGITGTPGNFVINLKTGETWLIPGAVPFETLKATIDEALSS